MRRLLLLPLLSLPPPAGAQEIAIPEALTGRFAQTREIRQAGVTLRSEGSFSFSRAKGIRWATEKPFSSTVTLSPGADPAGGEAARQVAAIVQGLLVQDYGALSKHFDVARSKGKDGFEVRLRATDETMAKLLSEIVITGDKYVKTVALSNRQGDTTTIRFTDVREPAGGPPGDGQR